MITEIKKGDRFLCHTAYHDGKALLHFAGKEYISENDGCITDEEGESTDAWNLPAVSNYFTRIDPDTQQDLTREAIEQNEVEGEMQLHAEDRDKAFVKLPMQCGQINWNKITENYNKVEDLIKERTAKSTATFQSITASLGDLLAYKNEKYGNSALEPLNIFGNKSKVGQRLDDKLSRVQNSPTLRKNDCADIIGYLILVCQENNWTNFDEFKD